MTTRRAFIGALAGGLLAAPLAAEAQPAGKVWRVGLIFVGSGGFEPETNLNSRAFVLGLQEHGDTLGHNLSIEFRAAEGKQEQLLALASELVRLNVDVIVTPGILATVAAKRASRSR